MANTGRKTKRGYKAEPDRELTVDDPLLTRAEVADVLGVTERWVHRSLQMGRLPYVRVGKLVRVRRSDLLAYIEAQRVTAQDG